MSAQLVPANTDGEFRVNLSDCACHPCSYWIQSGPIGVNTAEPSEGQTSRTVTVQLGLANKGWVCFFFVFFLSIPASVT